MTLPTLLRSTRHQRALYRLGCASCRADAVELRAGVYVCQACGAETKTLEPLVRVRQLRGRP